MAEYQTLEVDLSVVPTPDDAINGLASNGWTVHTVLHSDDTVFRALMEKTGSTNPASRVQPGRPAARP